MTVPFFDGTRQAAALAKELEVTAQNVLHSGRFVLGPEVEAFEHEFASWCGAGHAVGVASGTDAITHALMAVGVGAEDEVIVPANTCVPTLVGVAATGAVPVLADVDEETLTLDVDRIDEVLAPKTRAIVAVHLYGQCADMEGIRRVADRNGLAVIEDAAQAHGARLNGKRAGTFGHAAAFSFYPTKNLGAAGDGGAVVTNSPQVAEHARMTRNYGYSERDYAESNGMNSRLDEVQAALLRVKLTWLDSWNARRRELAERYLAAIAQLKGLRALTTASGSEPCWHLFVVRTPRRDELRAALLEAGVNTLIHYPRPLHLQPAYSGLRTADHLEVSERACREVLSLPLYPELSDAEQQLVIASLRRACRALSACRGLA